MALITGYLQLECQFYRLKNRVFRAKNEQCGLEEAAFPLTRTLSLREREVAAASGLLRGDSVETGLRYGKTLLGFEVFGPDLQTRSQLGNGFLNAILIEERLA